MNTKMFMIAAAAVAIASVGVGSADALPDWVYDECVEEANFMAEYTPGAYMMYFVQCVHEFKNLY